MKLILIRSLAWTLAVVALGAGVERLPVATPGLATFTVAAEPIPIAAPRKVALPVLATVYVVASPADIAAANEPVELTGVMSEDAVGRAGTRFVGRVGKGARLVGLAVPYYAFGGLASRAPE